MPNFAEISYYREPTPLECGQAVLVMLTGSPIDEVRAVCGTDRETTLSDMRGALAHYGIRFENMRREADEKDDLPDVCLLSLETPKCWHWSLYVHGTFYDPEHGVLDDFPACRRKYYWEIFED